MCRHRAAPLMPQQTSTFESQFLTHIQGVAGAYHKLIACSWVPILQVGGLERVRVNCFPKAITTWLGRESNPRPPDPESDALTTLPRCLSLSLSLTLSLSPLSLSLPLNSSPSLFLSLSLSLSLCHALVPSIFISFFFFVYSFYLFFILGIFSLTFLFTFMYVSYIRGQT